MLTRSMRVVILAIVVALPGCYPGGAPPLPGVQLSVPYYSQQQEFYCGETNVQMWEQFIWGSAESQQEILNFVQAYYPTEVGFDGSLTARDRGGRQFLRRRLD